MASGPAPLRRALRVGLRLRRCPIRHRRGHVAGHARGVDRGDERLPGRFRPGPTGRPTRRHGPQPRRLARCQGARSAAHGHARAFAAIQPRTEPSGGAGLAAPARASPVPPRARRLRAIVNACCQAWALTCSSDSDSSHASPGSRRSLHRRGGTNRVLFLRTPGSGLFMVTCYRLLELVILPL